jgi:hypothetical protein
MKIIGIMQPYFFPYIGYFQLINSVDEFFIYDEASFIKGGWIGRNRIMGSAEPFYINAALLGAGSNIEIFNVRLNSDDRWRRKLEKSILNCYGKSLYFEESWGVIRNAIYGHGGNIAEYNFQIIKKISDHLNISTNIVRSTTSVGNGELCAESRVIDLVRAAGGNVYVNSIGGVDLYDKESFLNNGIELRFLNSLCTNDVSDYLSIIHQLMTIGKGAVMRKLNDYNFLGNPPSLS